MASPRHVSSFTIPHWNETPRPRTRWISMSKKTGDGNGEISDFPTKKMVIYHDLPGCRIKTEIIHIMHGINMILLIQYITTIVSSSGDHHKWRLRKTSNKEWKLNKTMSRKKELWPPKLVRSYLHVDDKIQNAWSHESRYFTVNYSILYTWQFSMAILWVIPVIPHFCWINKQYMNVG